MLKCAIVGIGLLVLASALLVPAHMGGRPARCDLCLQQVRTALRAPLEQFREDVGRYPTTAEGLSALYDGPAALADAKRWAGPYVTSGDVKDPWQQPLRYVSDGRSYKLWSSGPNRIDESGGGDDIANARGTDR